MKLNRTKKVHQSLYHRKKAQTHTYMFILMKNSNSMQIGNDWKSLKAIVMTINAHSNVKKSGLFLKDQKYYLCHLN